MDRTTRAFVRSETGYFLTPGWPTIEEACAECHRIEDAVEPRTVRGVEPVRLADGSYSVFIKSIKVAGFWL